MSEKKRRVALLDYANEQANSLTPQEWAWFLGWGMENGETKAIIEMDDGSVGLTGLRYVRFLHPIGKPVEPRIANPPESVL